MRLGDHETHPFADIFPLMSSEELLALASDVEANGLADPITLLDGKVLDGRNRYHACLRVGATPRFVEWSGPDPIAFVLSKNLKRRHLNESQRAMVAARAKSMFESAARERMRSGKACPPANLPEGRGEAREKAAALVNVSPRSVENASKVLKKGDSQVIAAVDRGEIAVSRAAEHVSGKKREAPDPVARILREIAALTPEQRDQLFSALKLSEAVRS